MRPLKALFICGSISFVIVFGGWVCDKYIMNDWISFLLAIIWWIPGALILSIFKGGWAVIHVDRWIKLTPVISFVFWFIVILGIRKGILLLRKYFRKDGTPFDSNEIEIIKRLTQVK